MVEPLTLFTGVGLASFFGNLIYDAAKSTGQEVAKKSIERMKGEALARIAGAFGVATNHDAEKAIRRAHMAALRYLLTQYEQNAPKEDEQSAQFPVVFTDAAFAFADECTRTCDRQTLELREDVVQALAAALQAALATTPVADLRARAAALRRAASEAAFRELESAMAERRDRATGLPISIPAGFRALFFEGGQSHADDRIECWHDAFILQAADGLKGAEPKFEKIFAATHLAQTNELALDIDEIVRTTQDMVAGAAQVTAQNAHRLVAMSRAVERMRIELGEWRRENRDAHDRTHGKLDEIMAALQKSEAQKAGLDPRVLNPIFERLGRRGLSVEEMQAQAGQAVADFLAYVDGRIEKSNLGEDIDQAIAEARDLLRQSGRALAEQRLDAGISVEDRAIAEAQEVLVDRIRRKVALIAEKARMRRILLDYVGAREALGEILAADPADSWALVERGDIEIVIGTIEAALADFTAALSIERETGDEIRTGLVLERIGDVLRSRNDLDGALRHYQEGLEISRRLAQSDPTHAERARDVSASLERIGDVLRLRNDLDGALRHYQEKLEISRRLAKTDPTHAERARDVSVSVNKIGDVLRSRNDLDGALRHFEEGLEIRRRLAELDSTRADRARDVSVSVTKIGDVLALRDDLDGALRHYQEGLEISSRLAQADPAHAERARDVSASLERIGDVLRLRNDQDGALWHYQEKLEISRSLAQADPAHAERARDVSVSVTKIGDVLRLRNDLDGALRHYEEGLEISRRLAQSDPTHAGRARDVAMGLLRIGVVHEARGDTEAACRNYRQARSITIQLAERASDVHILKTDLQWCDERIAATCGGVPADA